MCFCGENFKFGSSYVHIKSDKFENYVFFAKIANKFLGPHYRFPIVHAETLLRRDCDRDYMAVVTSVFSKSSVFAQPTFSNSATLESFFKKFLFRFSVDATSKR